MSKNFTKILYSISFISIIHGIFLFGVRLYTLLYFLDFGANEIENFESKFSIYQTVISYHYEFLLSIFQIIAGITLFKKLKFGYTSTLLCSILLAFKYFGAIIAYANDINFQTSIRLDSFFYDTNFIEITVISLFFLLPILFSIIPFILLKKNFRRYFLLNNKTYFISLIIILLGVLNQFFLMGSKITF